MAEPKSRVSATSAMPMPMGMPTIITRRKSCSTSTRRLKKLAIYMMVMNLNSSLGWILKPNGVASQRRAPLTISPVNGTTAITARVSSKR